jgi:hypothetical protein
MHDFTTFERTAPVGDDNDPIRKYMKKFKCQACKKDKFHIPLKTVDGRTVCIHCCLSESGQNIVLDKRTVDALEAVANRINGTEEYEVDPHEKELMPNIGKILAEKISNALQNVHNEIKKDLRQYLVCDLISAAVFLLMALFYYLQHHS